jgi:hypothetical protein
MRSDLRFILFLPQEELGQPALAAGQHLTETTLMSGTTMRLASDAALEAKARVGKPERLRQVKTLGVDGHIWRPSRIGQDRAVTIMVDLTRDRDGCLHARLLYAVVGRPGNAYKSWLQNQPKEFTAGMIPNLVGSSTRLSLRSTGV